jgi:hypothetical protein
MLNTSVADPGVYPGSEFFPSRIRIKEFKYFNPKNCFQALTPFSKSETYEYLQKYFLTILLQ